MGVVLLSMEINISWTPLAKTPKSHSQAHHLKEKSKKCQLPATRHVKAGQSYIIDLIHASESEPGDHEGKRQETASTPRALGTTR